jgi:predicted transcriptional regulator
LLFTSIIFLFSVLLELVTSTNTCQILNVLSNSKACLILKTTHEANDLGVAEGVIMDKAGLTHSSFHTSMSMLQDQSLIERRNGKYLITFLGKAVYNVRIILEKAVNHYHQLKVIDSIIEKQELSMSEFYKIIDIMIEDYQLKDILNGYDITKTTNLDSKLSSIP